MIKHANATLLDISIVKSADGIDVLIEDNGIGFNLNDLPQRSNIGLSNKKSRIQYLEGTVEWNTRKNNGTLVAIFIPLKLLTDVMMPEMNGLKLAELVSITYLDMWIFIKTN
jgi:nitrate/nitrite-specific signal transduction histidine kinase